MKYSRSRVNLKDTPLEETIYVPADTAVGQRFSIYVSGFYVRYRNNAADPIVTFRDPTGKKEDMVIHLSGKPGIGGPHSRGNAIHTLDNKTAFMEWLTGPATEYFSSNVTLPEGSGVKYTPLPSRLRESMKDVKTIGFKRLSSQGAVVNNPMEKRSININLPHSDRSSVVDNLTTEGVFQSGSYSNGNGTYYIIIKGTARASAPLSSSVLMDRLEVSMAKVGNTAFANAQNAVNSAYGNINVSDLQALVVAGEGRETLLLMHQTMSRFIKIVRAFKSGNWAKIAPLTLRNFRSAKLKNKAAKLADFSSDAWLEARYAWRPLISDAQAAFALLNGKKSLMPRQTFRGFESANSNFEFTDTFAAHGFTYTVNATVTCNQNVRAGVLCQAELTDYVNELSLTNLVDAAWDLVPFSFVVDWFVNLGGLLFHLRPSGGYEVKAAWVTTVTTVDVAGSITVLSPSGAIESNQFTVTKQHSVREPGATPTLFSIDLNLDLSKIVDSIALLRKLSK